MSTFSIGDDHTLHTNKMKFQWSVVAAALLCQATTSDAFVPEYRPTAAAFGVVTSTAIANRHHRQPQSSSSFSSSALFSSVVADDTHTFTKAAPPPERGGISMTVDELALTLGGRGRARLAWDLYSIGVDPQNWYGRVIHLGHDDFESILELLPSNRRSQRLGPKALSKLASLYPQTGGMVEGGVASLSYVSQTFDKTTKLLLRLADGLEVETVIIPWKGSRSTLCVSSQVGCRQVRFLPLAARRTRFQLL